jgi:hypothetical protein
MLNQIRAFGDNTIYDIALFNATLKNNIISNCFLILLFVFVEILNYIIFFNSSDGATWAFWTITGTIISILVTLILLQPSNKYLLEKENINHTQEIIKNIYFLFYLYMEISRIYTNAEENEFYEKDYYSKSYYKKNIISDLQRVLGIIKPISSMEQENKLRQQHNLELKNIFGKLKEIKEIFSNIPYELSINYIRYDLIELMHFVESHYFKGGTSCNSFYMISEKYLKLLEKMNKNEYIYSIRFTPYKMQVFTANCEVNI